VRPARLFVALWPDEETRARLETELVRWAWSATTRTTIAERLHLTLHFIGFVERARVSEVLAGLVVDFRPFELSFGREALWKNGIAAFQPLVLTDELRHLHATLTDSLQRLMLPVEPRRYRPHVTLARDAIGSNVPDDPPPFAWAVDRYALVESKPGGAYEVLAYYPADKSPSSEAADLRSSPASAAGDTTTRR
jgi:2'-5' RNA ligase